MRRLGRMAVGALCATAFMLPLQFLGGTTAAQADTFTPLTLRNGWTNAPRFGTSNTAVSTINGIVHFKGAIQHGTGSPFTLPAAFRPATNVYVPVGLCHATKGRLFIRPTGVVTVQATMGAFANAQCFTSLDGASFATSASSFTPLTLQNGWANAAFGTSNAAVRTIGGIVHFKGAIAHGAGSPFTLPPAFRPATNVYVPVDLCNAYNGWLVIQPSGVVTVQQQDGFPDGFAWANCFTSLDGASFARSARAFTPLTPQNGWTNSPIGTSDAAVRTIGGIVHFKGAIAHGTGSPFTLPPAFRPATNVYVPVNLGDITSGLLFIKPTGVVTVQPEWGDFGAAYNFTSLDGARFAL